MLNLDAKHTFSAIIAKYRIHGLEALTDAERKVFESAVTLLLKLPASDPINEALKKQLGHCRDLVKDLKTKDDEEWNFV